MKNGLVLKVSEFDAYVDCNHLTDLADSVKNYTIGQELVVRVLYKESLSNRLHCSLNNAVVKEM